MTGAMVLDFASAGARVKARRQKCGHEPCEKIVRLRHEANAPGYCCYDHATIAQPNHAKVVLGNRPGINGGDDVA